MIELTPPSGVFLCLENMSREILHVVTNRKRLDAPVRGLVVEAHADDRKMANIAVALANQGVGVSVATATDNSARDLAAYTPEALAKIRWDESTDHARIVNAAQVFQRNLPDGKLQNHHLEAEEFLRLIVAMIQPDFVIAPNLHDPHPDHAAAYRATLAAVEDSIPLYGMDTITGEDREGRLVVPTHYIRLSRRSARLENYAYKDGNTSQTTNIPPYEMRDVHAVLAMSKRRGREIGFPHATILVKEKTGNTDDPIAEILGKDVFIA